MWYFSLKQRMKKTRILWEILKNLFISRNNDFITAIDEKNIIIVRSLEENDGYEEIEGIAKMIVDMLNAEAMSQVRVSYEILSMKSRTCHALTKKRKWLLM